MKCFCPVLVAGLFICASAQTIPPVQNVAPANQNVVLAKSAKTMSVSSPEQIKQIISQMLDSIGQDPSDQYNVFYVEMKHFRSIKKVKTDSASVDIKTTGATGHNLISGEVIVETIAFKAGKIGDVSIYKIEEVKRTVTPFSRKELIGNAPPPPAPKLGTNR